MAINDVALSAACSLDLAKRLIEQHIDETAEILGEKYYSTLDNVITQLNCTINELNENNSEAAAAE